MKRNLSFNFYRISKETKMLYLSQRFLECFTLQLELIQLLVKNIIYHKFESLGTFTLDL